MLNAARRLMGLLFPKVQEVMSTPLVSIPSEASVTEAVEVMVQKGIGSVVVVDDGKLIGIFTRRDLMNRVLKAKLDSSVTRVSEVMSSPLVTVRTGESIIAAVQKMLEAGITRLVVEREGQGHGILTETDIRLKFSHGYLSRTLFAKKFAVDTLAYVAFWSAFAFINQVLIVGIEIEKFVISSVIGLIYTTLLAGVFGRYLDIIRQKFRV